MKVAGPLENTARRIAEEIRRGNLPLAEFLCRDLLESAPDYLPARNLLGVIATRLGLREQAISFFSEVLSQRPGSEFAKKHLEKAMSLPAAGTAGESKTRFLLIKAWGFGFWSDVTHVLGCLLLAEITGRIPVTHWGGNSKFSPGGGVDAFNCFFEPVSPYTLTRLTSRRDAAFFPPKWTADNIDSDVDKLGGRFSRMGGIYYLNRHETIAVSDFYIGVVDLLPWVPQAHPLYGKSVDEAYRYLAAKYLKPRRHILSAISDFRLRHLEPGPAVAVHIRGSDKKREYPGLDVLNRSYFAHIDGLNPDTMLFLLTDDASWADAFRERYGTRVTMTACTRTQTDSGLHYQPVSDRVRLGTEVVIDTYLALGCRNFIGNGRSNVSAVIAALGEWKPGACVLVAPSILHSRNLLIHRRRKP